MEQYKVILTQDGHNTMQRNGYVGVKNPHVYLQPLNKFWEIFKGIYDAPSTVIAYNSKEKHVSNDEGNYVITKGYNCDNVNDKYLL